VPEPATVLEAPCTNVAPELRVIVPLFVRTPVTVRLALAFTARVWPVPIVKVLTVGVTVPVGMITLFVEVGTLAGV